MHCIEAAVQVGVNNMAKISDMVIDEGTEGMRINSYNRYIRRKKCGLYRLLEHGMKVLERVLEKVKQVITDGMQFAFMPGKRDN